MAKKFDFLSPGIEIREIDQSFIPAQRDAEGPIIIGRTRKGPANKPVKIRNLDDYVSIFGLPVPGGNGVQGDMWRDGNMSGPTYASYAAQSWLASENSPITVVRIAGEQHPQAASDAAKAGWSLSGSMNSAKANNSTAYGLFLIASASANTMTTGSLAAVFYANKGYLALSGAAAADGSQVEQAGTFVKSVGSNSQFKLVIGQPTSGKETISFNFSRNSADYIRSVFNTNPQLVNEDTIPSAQRETYWLGESFAREVEDLGLSTKGSGEVYGILLPLGQGTGADKNWGYHKEGAEESASGMVISQKSTQQRNLFQFKSLHVGEDIQKDYMIAIEDIREPTNPIVSPYGTFTVSIKNMSGQSVERYTNLNLNPSDPNYLGKRIGDQRLEWSDTDRRYRTLGNFINQSNIIYVDIQQFIEDGGGQGFLPAGFKGPVRPKGFTLLHNSAGAQTLGDSDNTGAQATSVIYTDSASGLSGLTFIFNNLDGTSHTITAQSAGGGGTTKAIIDTDDVGNANDLATKLQEALALAIGAGDVKDVSVSSVENDGAGNPRKITLTATLNGTYANSITIGGTLLSGNKIYINPSETQAPFSQGTAGLEGGTDTDDFTNAFVRGNDDVPETGGSATNFVAGPTNFTASFLFPAIALRGNGTEGGAPDPYRAYYGIRPKISTTSTLNDPDYCDYLRRLPQGIDNYTPGADFEHSFIFTLDDLIVDTNNNTVTYTSGAHGLGTSFTAQNDFGKLLEQNVRQFLMPLHGGFEGFDITEKEPLRDGLISSTRNDRNDHIHYTLNKALDSVKDPEVVPANLLIMPGIREPSITNRMISIAEERKDVLAILDLENDYLPTAERLDGDTDSSKLGSVKEAVSSVKQRNFNSSYACAFYPWVQIADNLNGGQLVWIPPSVAALGALGRSQAQSELWFAPAGFNRGGLGSLGGPRGPRVLQARQRLDSSERDKLYEVNINPIATFPAEGVVIFGQKTLQADQSALDRINVRRLLLYLKSEVSVVARNLLFDQNVESTWNRFKAQVNPLLSDTRARFGITDYRLILDDTTTTADLIDRNILYAKIFIKPARAIEYIVVDFVITRTGADFV